jgi:integrase
MGKRSNGEGSLNRRANGTWLAQVSIDGKRLSRTFRLRKDAQDWLTSTTGQVKQGLTYSSSKTTVDELLMSWLAMKKTNKRPATIELYSRMVKLYISPSLGSMKLQEITPAKIQAFYSDMEKNNKGRRTIELVHTILHGFLDHANKQGLVAQNWSEMVEVPRPGKREMSVWDETQVSKFLITVPEDPFYRLAFATGMRRGELAGVQWKDLDWNTGMLHITRQVFEPEGGGWNFQSPKTERGRRGVRLGPGLLEALRKQYASTIPLMRAIAGNNWQENDLMFPTEKGTPRNGDNIYREFSIKAKESGLPVIRFHDIRHTAASIMLLHGEPPVRVASILGQSVGVLLSTYAHYIQDDQEKASRLMDDITTVNTIDLNGCIILHQKEGVFSENSSKNQ